jgi:2-polyprenyl-3-methyl-5-hydroxy-6-metoxy-1,4-benzoquinol methylase
LARPCGPIVDDRTRNYYDTNATKIAGRYESIGDGVSTLFATLFSAGETVLDVGPGSGRDMALLHAMGVDVWGLEPSDGLREAAGRCHPEIKEKLVAGALPSELDALAGRTFHAVVLSAVIMHIPDTELPECVVSIRDLLRIGGRVVVSTSTHRDDVDPTTGRDAGGRLFRLRSADEVQRLLENHGFRIEDRFSSDDVLGRPGMKWATLVGKRLPDPE